MTKDTRKTSSKQGSSKKSSTARKGSKAAAARRRKKQKQKRVLFAVEAIVLVILVIAVFISKKFDKLDNSVIVEDKDIVTNTDREVSKETDDGYLNVALFGIDSRENNSFGAGNRSDSIMVASINNKTGDVKIVSVYRDTYLHIADKDKDRYRKCNEAYFYGGPTQAMNMLNMNLDLDITKYVAVDFNALVKTVDLLGGIEVELSGEEIHHLNNYTVETSAVTGVETEWLDEDQPGTYLLDGVQAVSYARIRYTSGSDYKRTERQRLIIQKIAEKAKSASLTTLNSIVNEVLPYVSTNFSATEVLGLAADIAKYNIADTAGFPFDKTTTILSSGADVVVPVTLESNVTQLYEFLFNENGYTPSSTVKSISKKVETDTGISSLN